MTLVMTRTARWTAIVTLFFFGGQLLAPAAWAQSPSMPASGAPASGAGSAPTPTKPGSTTPATAGPAAAASRGGTGNTPWPREATEGGRTYTVYQPQIEKWDGTRLHARAAVSVESQASPVQHFGVVWFSARADVDKVSRLVALADFRVDKVTFPSAPDRAAGSGPDDLAGGASCVFSATTGGVVGFGGSAAFGGSEAFWATAGLGSSSEAAVRLVA